MFLEPPFRSPPSCTAHVVYIFIAHLASTRRPEARPRRLSLTQSFKQPFFSQVLPILSMQDPVIPSTSDFVRAQLALDARCDGCAGCCSNCTSQDVLVVLHPDSCHIHRLEQGNIVPCHCFGICIQGYNCVGRGTAKLQPGILDSWTKSGCLTCIGCKPVDPHPKDSKAQSSQLRRMQDPKWDGVEAGGCRRWRIQHERTKVPTRSNHLGTTRVEVCM
mmetsp:Transcript_9923/g.60573  ORF Transcript_9923/g.60573 Transcript_9923/m.60573 type:complete len:218 (+) Transcript_9923:670-1323(+)